MSCGPMGSAKSLSSYSSTVSASAGSGPSSSRLSALKVAFSVSDEGESHLAFFECMSDG